VNESEQQEIKLIGLKLTIYVKSSQTWL